VKEVKIVASVHMFILTGLHCAGEGDSIDLDLPGKAVPKD
jgi:hypothetical protein